MDVGEGREQGAEALRLGQSFPASCSTGEGVKNPHPMDLFRGFLVE